MKTNKRANYANDFVWENNYLSEVTKSRICKGNNKANYKVWCNGRWETLEIKDTFMLQKSEFKENCRERTMV